jgi:Tfp pilus assembly protein PilF
MADAADAQARLASLRRRWEADPASRVFLQLAEEYRRLGHLTEAVEVIEGGLRHHPSYLSAHVALARCRVELGDFELAEPTLRKVLGQDPTQMVAMKLLVQSYLGQGRTADAADWLARYELLAVNDDDIALLRARVTARAGAAAARADEPLLAQAVAAVAAAEPTGASVVPGEQPAAAAAEPAPTRPAHRQGLLFELPALAGPPLDLASLSRPGRPRLPLHYSSALSEPFPHLYSDLPRRLGEGELFRAPAAGAALEPPAALIPPPELQEPTRAPEQAAVAPALAAEPLEALALPAPVVEAELAAEADDAVAAGEPVAEAGAGPIPAIEVEPVAELAPLAAEPDASAGAPTVYIEAPEPVAHDLVAHDPEVAWVETPSPEPVEEPATALEPDATPPVPAAAGPVEWRLGETEAAAAPPVAETSSATVTLADLHSQQGYLDDAEDLYRQVLAREPWNARAAAGLRQVALRRPPSLDALSLLRGFRSTGGGLTAKKTHVLRSYLEQLRRRG